jgi:hypothetical protein
MIPPFIKPALERLASTYNSQYHTAFTQKLVEQIRTELDTATTASSATGPQTDAAVPPNFKAVHVTGGGDEPAARVAAAASAAAKGVIAPVLLHRSVSVQLPKTPEENPLISAKLANPDKKLSPDESVALLTMCIQYGRMQAERAEAKDLLIFIGNTGAGQWNTCAHKSCSLCVAIVPHVIEFLRLYSFPICVQANPPLRTTSPAAH